MSGFETIDCGNDITDCDALTFPQYRALLHDSPPGVRAFIARIAGRPVGLALWRLYEDRNQGRLLSLRVAPTLRRQGIATRVLLYGQERVKPEVEQIVTYWSSTSPGATAFAKTLDHCGWDQPVLDVRRISGTATTAKAWLDRADLERFSRRPGWNVVDFGQIDLAQREAIMDQVVAAGVAKAWSPFANLEGQKIIPDLSLIVEKDGRLVGWVIGAEAPTGEHWFYNLEMVGIHRGDRAYVLMAILVEAHRRHHRIYGPEARWRWTTGPQRPGMLDFMQRFGQQFADRIDDYLCASLTAS